MQHCCAASICEVSTAGWVKESAAVSKSDTREHCRHAKSSPRPILAVTPGAAHSPALGPSARCSPSQFPYREGGWLGGFSGDHLADGKYSVRIGFSSLPRKKRPEMPERRGWDGQDSVSGAVAVGSPLQVQRLRVVASDTSKPCTTNPCRGWAQPSRTCRGCGILARVGH